MRPPPFQGQPQHLRDRRAKRLDVARYDQTAACERDHFAASRVVCHDDRRAAEERFERDETEDLMLRWIDEHVGTRQKFETIATGHQSGEDDATLNAEVTCKGAGGMTAAHVVAGDDQRRLRRVERGEGTHQRRHPFARCEFSEIRHERAALHTRSRAEPFSTDRRLELLERKRVRHDGDALRRNPCRRKLLALRTRHCYHSGRAAHNVTEDRVERTLGRAVPLQIWCRAVRGNYVGDPALLSGGGRQSLQAGFDTHAGARHRTSWRAA